MPEPQIARGERHRAGSARRGHIALGLGADHGIGEPRLGPAGKARGGHLAAIAQDGGHVAERQHLGEAMRHIHDRHALRPQPPDSGEQLLGLALPERCGRLVEHQYPGIRSQRLGDLDHLPLGERKTAHRRTGRDLQAQAAKGHARPRVHRADIEQAAPRWLSPQREVLRHRQVRQQAEFLVDNRDAECERMLGTPASRIVPASACSMPDRMLITVDLPAPF